VEFKRKSKNRGFGKNDEEKSEKREEKTGYLAPTKELNRKQRKERQKRDFPEK